MSLRSNAVRPVDEDQAWTSLRDQWRFPPGVTYLNHGSFGPPALPVRETRARWQEQLDTQPMQFFVRAFEPAWHAARSRVAEFLHTSPNHLIPVDNATTGMNLVAGAFPLGAGDEVLLTDHEYGAVWRIWERACRRHGARTVAAPIPLPIHASDEILDAIDRRITERTRLLVVSHITSATALILPVAAICELARLRGVAVCIDGPHALVQQDVRLDQLDCDFYTASCHKWLAAPFGSGLLYVHPQYQERFEPAVLSWGRLRPNEPRLWFEEFIWSGTRDPSSWLSIPAAIEFLEQVGIAEFRQRTHWLAQQARQSLASLFGQAPLTPDDPTWYGSMIALPLPPGDHARLQQALWEQYGIEVPVMYWNDRWLLRVSFHLYNTRRQLELLVRALQELLKLGR